MTLRHQILAAEDGFDLLRLDPEYTGSCPCAKIEDEAEGITIETNCWRTFQWYAVQNAECDHQGVCAHLWGADEAIAAHVKDVLDAMDWYGEWEVVQEGASIP